VGFLPDPWAWTPWVYAEDQGLFNGRWDDQQGKFRTLYSSNRLLGCLLELLGRLKPNEALFDALDAMADDDPDGTAAHPGTPVGELDWTWLEGRAIAKGRQAGRYCEITHSETMSELTSAGVFRRLNIPDHGVDVTLLKDARNRVTTRTVARWLYDQRDRERRVLVDGIAFGSRHGDDLRMWAVFSRDDTSDSSPLIAAIGEPEPLTPENPYLLEAFRRFGLHWPAE
jgi:hypothetical protein